MSDGKIIPHDGSTDGTKDNQAARIIDELVDKLENDKRFKEILEAKSLEYLKTKNAKWFNNNFSEDIAPSGYLLDKHGKETNSLPSQNITAGYGEVSAAAEKEFNEKYPEESRKYGEIERKRIYQNPEQDPAYRKTADDILRETNKEIVRRENTKKSGRGLDKNVGGEEIHESENVRANLQGWDNFVRQYPEKAAAYQNQNRYIKKAFDRTNRKEDTRPASPASAAQPKSPSSESTSSTAQPAISPQQQLENENKEWEEREWAARIKAAKEGDRPGQKPPEPPAPSGPSGGIGGGGGAVSPTPPALAPEQPRGAADSGQNFFTRPPDWAQEQAEARRVLEEQKQEIEQAKQEEAERKRAAAEAQAEAEAAQAAGGIDELRSRRLKAAVAQERVSREIRPPRRKAGNANTAALDKEIAKLKAKASGSWQRPYFLLMVGAVIIDLLQLLADGTLILAFIAVIIGVIFSAARYLVLYFECKRLDDNQYRKEMVARTFISGAITIIPWIDFLPEQTVAMVYEMQKRKLMMDEARKDLKKKIPERDRLRAAAQAEEEEEARMQEIQAQQELRAAA